MLVVQLFPVRSVWAAIAETRQEEISKDLSAIVFKLKSKASWLKLCHSRSSAKHLELGLQNAWILQIAYMQSILTKDHLPCFRSFAYVPLGTGPKQKQILKKTRPRRAFHRTGSSGSRVLVELGEVGGRRHVLQLQARPEVRAQHGLPAAGPRADVRLKTLGVAAHPPFEKQSGRASLMGGGYGSK